MMTITADTHFPMMLTMLALMAFAGLLIRAALEDLFERRIPNLVCAGIVVSFFLYALVTPQPVDWSGSFSVAALAFGLGAVLFYRGAMGGGDVKLMTACGLWCGFDMSVTFALVVCLTGGVLALLYLLVSYVIRIRTDPKPPVMRLVPTAWPGQNTKQGAGLPCDDLPYGIAIAAGGGWVATELFLHNLAIMGGVS